MEMWQQLHVPAKKHLIRPIDRVLNAIVWSINCYYSVYCMKSYSQGNEMFSQRVGRSPAQLHNPGLGKALGGNCTEMHICRADDPDTTYYNGARRPLTAPRLLTKIVPGAAFVSREIRNAASLLGDDMGCNGTQGSAFETTASSPHHPKENPWPAAPGCRPPASAHVPEHRAG